MSPSAPSPRPGKAPSVAVRLALGLGVAVALLGVVELGLRALLGPPPPALRVFGVLGPQDTYWERQGDLLLPRWGGEHGDVGLTALPCQPDRPQAVVLGGSSVHGGSEGGGRDE